MESFRTEVVQLGVALEKKIKKQIERHAKYAYEQKRSGLSRLECRKGLCIHYLCNKLIVERDNLKGY